MLPADVSLFSDLLDAVMSCREVAFDYHKLTANKPEHRQVRPYHVGQIEHGWYLIAHDVQRRALRTFALQRLSNLEVLKVRFERPKDFNARDQLGGSFGVWNDEAQNRKRHGVKIRFEGYAARVVAERRWHPSQKIEQLDNNGDAIEFAAHLAGLEDITRWILSWGSKAHVIAPAELKERVRAEVDKMARA